MKAVNCKPIAALSLDGSETRLVDFTVHVGSTGPLQSLTLAYSAFNCLLHQVLTLNVQIEIIPELSVLSLTTVTCVLLSSLSAFLNYFY